MDAKTLFWTGALVNLAVIIALAASGVARVRRGDVLRHRRRMRAAASLVFAFVLAYALKLAALGREDLGLWSDDAVLVLRVHEVCILSMILAGAEAARRARWMRTTRVVTQRLEDPAAPIPLRQGHRRAGWTALVAAGMAGFTAIFILWGMIERAATAG